MRKRTSLSGNKPRSPTTKSALRCVAEFALRLACAVRRAATRPLRPGGARPAPQPACTPPACAPHPVVRNLVRCCVLFVRQDLLDMSKKEQDLSTVLVSAQFLQKTLPPMLAKRIKDLQVGSVCACTFHRTRAFLVLPSCSLPPLSPPKSTLTYMHARMHTYARACASAFVALLVCVCDCVCARAHGLFLSCSRSLSAGAATAISGVGGEHWANVPAIRRNLFAHPALQARD